MNLNGIARMQRGQVWCTECDKTHKVNIAASAASGWPQCCGLTMTIDSPEERGLQKDESDD